jgi:Concanavalin A-like lectin/glucanases superfamily
LWLAAQDRCDGQKEKLLMNHRLYLPFTLLAIWGGAAGVYSAKEKTSIMKQTIWDLNTVGNFGGYPTQVLGTPRLIETPQGKAMEFDGQQDGIIVEANPLAETERFTLEVIFRPDAGGPKEQRFVHLQEAGGENRILIETRLTSDNRWFLDTFIRSGETNQTLYAEKFLHAVGEWYQAALVFDGREMRHYVNGIQEMSALIQYQPMNPGQISLGVRLNRVFWFKGAIRKVRFTHDALAPADFLKP